MTDSGTRCAWVIHESKAVQIHVHHSNRRCLYVPRVPGSVKNPHNNNSGHLRRCLFVTQLPGSIKNLKTQLEISVRNKSGASVIFLISKLAQSANFKKQLHKKKTLGQTSLK